MDHSAKKPDDRFIREMQMQMWKDEELLDRCIDDKRAKSLPGHPPRKILTPKKTNVILSK